MEDLKLSAELEHVERLLLRDPRPMPSAALRQRVMADIRSELHHRYSRPAWRFAGAFAATLLLCLGVSFAAAQAAGYTLQQCNFPAPVRELADQIHRLTPDISPEEAVRRAMLVEIAAQVGRRTSLCSLLEADNAKGGQR